MATCGCLQDLGHLLYDFAGHGVFRDGRRCGSVETIFARLAHLVQKAPVPQNPVLFRNVHHHNVHIRSAVDCALHIVFDHGVEVLDSQFEDFVERL